MQLPNLSENPVTKLKMAAITVAKCRNWAPVLLARLRLSKFNGPILLKNGLVLHLMHSIDRTWMEFFCPAIADIYSILDENPDFIVDVGGNIGSFSCLAAHAHPSAKVLVFEPSKVALPMLYKNRDTNQLKNLQIVEMPLTADGRQVEFQDVGSGGSSNIYNIDGDYTTVQISSSSIADINYGNSKRVFYKLDCEGAEGELLLWVAEHWKSLPPDLTFACEWHPWCPQPKEQVLAALKRAGFGISEFHQYGEDHIRVTRKA